LAVRWYLRHRVTGSSNHAGLFMLLSVLPSKLGPKQRTS
jgi:hypothetical protein